MKWEVLKLICTILKCSWNYLKLTWIIWNSFGNFWNWPELSEIHFLSSAFFGIRESPWRTLRLVYIFWLKVNLHLKKAYPVMYWEKKTHKAISIIWNYWNFWYSSYIRIMYVGVRKALYFVPSSSAMYVLITCTLLLGSHVGGTLNRESR